MRLLALMPLLVLASCSEGGEAPKKAESEAPATQLTSGQWEMTAEVMNVTQRDQGPPAIKDSKGSKSTTSVCIAEADAKKPQPALFTPEGYDCSYRDVYMSSGRINATLACTRPGLSGNIATIVNGSFKAESIDATAVTETSLLTAGDVRIEAKLTGKRTGACTEAAG